MVDVTRGLPARGPSLGRRWLPTLSVCLRGVGFLFVVIGLYGPLTVTGPGSAIDVRTTADLFLSGTVEAWAPRWVGMALYVPALLAAAGLAAAALTGAAARRASIVLAIVGVALVLAIAMVVGRGLPLRAGDGYAWMLTGSVLALIGAAMPVNGWANE